jgi:hypothetical protein
MITFRRWQRQTDRDPYRATDRAIQAGRGVRAESLTDRQTDPTSETHTERRTGKTGRDQQAGGRAGRQTPHHGLLSVEQVAGERLCQLRLAVGPRNMKDAMGRSGSDSPARDLRPSITHDYYATCARVEYYGLQSTGAAWNATLPADLVLSVCLSVYQPACRLGAPPVSHHDADVPPLPQRDSKTQAVGQNGFRAR